MTRLYYTDSHTRSFRARVVGRTEIGGQPAVVLDGTYFYPTGGGQPHDTGVIGGLEVLDVVTRPEDKAVLHIVASPILDDTVDCTINWPRRFDHMQQHTGQHILTQAFVQTSALHTVGFHLSADTVTIDLDAGTLPPEAITTAEDLANQIVWEDRPVTARLIDPNDAEGVRMRRIPGQLTTDGLRVVDVEGFDQTACGGTHVARTGEIGLIKVIRAEKRGDKTRVEFRCGGRALADYRQKNTVAVGLMADLTVGLDEVRVAVARLQESARDSQRSLKAASSRLLELGAAEILASQPVAEGVRVIARVFMDKDAADLRTLAGLLTRPDNIIALLAAPAGERVNLVFARSASLSTDMNVLLRQALSELPGGKGGGQPQLAQGGALASAGDVAPLLERLAQDLKQV